MYVQMCVYICVYVWMFVIFIVMELSCVVSKANRLSKGRARSHRYLENFGNEKSRLPSSLDTMR